MAREPRRECRFGDPIAVPIAGATAFGEPRSDRDIERWIGLERVDHPRQQCFVMLEVTVDHRDQRRRSEEHTSELQSLMRISYAVFCLKKKNRSNSAILYIIIPSLHLIYKLIT